MKTMTKKSFLKLAMTVMAAFMFTSAMGQTYTDGTVVTGWDQVPYASTGETHMIEGQTIPIYAEPDGLYHPDYDATAGNWQLRDGFTWVWTQGPVEGAGETLVFSQNSVQDNYVEVTAPASSAGSYTINVKETAPAAWGGCDDGAGTNITVNVYEAPTLGFGGNQTVEACAGDASLPGVIHAIIAGGWQNYRLAWTLEIATLDNNLLKDEWFDTDLTTSLGAGLAYAEDFTEAAPQAVGSSGNHNIMSVAAFNLIGGKPVKYTYTLNGINDQASRFGEFIGFVGDRSTAVAGDFSYNAASDTYTVTVYPTPTTGPIYHIPSTWAN